MKIKISVFVLLLSLLVGMFGAVPVKADSDTYIDSDFVFDLDSFTLSGNGINYTLSQNTIDEVAKYDNLTIFMRNRNNNFDLFLFAYNNDLSLAKFGGTVYFLTPEVSPYFNSDFDFTGKAYVERYTFIETTFDESYTYGVSLNRYDGFEKDTLGYVVGNSYSDWCYYSTKQIYTVDYSSSTQKLFLTDVLFYELPAYTFENWCSDAGLNCAASSNESSSVIPYSYNDYWHIVRRSSFGQWLLTTIGNSKEQQDMQLRISEDEGNFIIYNTFSGDGTDSSVNGYLAHVRQYVYDTDGWKQLSYSTYDFRELSNIVLELEAGSGFDDTKILAYTNTDIYSFNGFAIMYGTSTEYIDVSDTPIITLSPTPTTAPDSGSSGSGRPGSGTRPDTGGQATGGGGLDFIINLFTMIWTKICSVPMSVDGYSISLQQIIVYGALVSIVGGFIMHFIFGRK